MEQAAAVDASAAPVSVTSENGRVAPGGRADYSCGLGAIGGGGGCVSALRLGSLLQTDSTNPTFDNALCDALPSSAAALSLPFLGQARGACILAA